MHLRRKRTLFMTTTTPTTLLYSLVLSVVPLKLKFTLLWGALHSPLPDRHTISNLPLSKNRENVKRRRRRGWKDCERYQKNLLKESLCCLTTRTTAVKPHKDSSGRIKPHPSLPRSALPSKSLLLLSQIAFSLLCDHLSEKFWTPPIYSSRSPTTLIEDDIAAGGRGAQPPDQFYCPNGQNGLFSSKVVKSDLQRQFILPPDKRSSSLICFAKMVACK